MRHIAPFVTVVVMVASLMGAARAELTPEQAKTAERLIREFSAREFAVRHEAVEKLIAMGPDVLPLIRKALAGTQDGEVKLRCEMVLRGIDARHGADWGKTPGAGRRGVIDFEATLITLKVTHAELEDVLDELHRQSGNEQPQLTEDPEVRTVTLDVRDRPYWEVIALLCRMTKLTCERDMAEDRVVLKPLRDGTEVWALAGPVAVRARPDPKGADGEKQPAGSINYELDYFWEDRLPVADAVLSIEAITAPDGGPLRLYEYHRERQWDAETPSAGRARIRIDGVPEHLRSIAEIKGVLKMEQVRGKVEITVKGSVAAKEARGETEGLSVRVQSARREPNSVWGVLALKGPKGKDTPFGPPGDPRYGFFLIDPRGERHRPWQVLFGDHHVSECPHGGWFAFGTTCAHMRTVGFRVVPPDPDRWSLLCIVPKETASGEIPFTLRNIPIPPAKGE